MAAQGRTLIAAARLALARCVAARSILGLPDSIRWNIGRRLLPRKPNHSTSRLLHMAR